MHGIRQTIQGFPLWLQLQLLAGAMLIALSLIAMMPSDATLEASHETGAQIYLNIEPSVLLRPGDCMTLRWLVEGAKEVYLEEKGRASGGIVEEEICDDDDPIPTMRVVYSDDSEEIFELAPTFLVHNPLLWLDAIIAVSMLALSTYLIDRRFAVIVGLIGLRLSLMPIYQDYLFRRLLSFLDRAAWHWVFIIAASLFLVAVRTTLRKEPIKYGIRAFSLLMVIQSPIPILYSLPLQLRYAQLDALQPLSQGLLIVIYGVPLLISALVLFIPPARIKDALNNALVAAGSVVFVVLLLEIGIRFILPQLTQPEAERFRIGVPYDEDSITMRPNTIWFHEYPSNPRGYFEDGNRVNYETNSAGFRDREFALEKTDSVTRIAFIGDSFGHGSGVHYEDMASVILENTLNKQFGCAVEVYNFSVGGYNTPDQAQVMREVVVDFEPDVVIIWYYLNDIGRSTSQYFGDEALVRQENPFLRFGREFSVVAEFTAQQMQQLVQSQQSIADFIGFYRSRLWDDVVVNLEDIVNTTQSIDAQPLLFIHPILYRLDDSYPYQTIHEQVRATSDELGFMTFDLLDALKGYPYRSLWVHEVDSHANEIGHRVTGEYAAEKIAPLISNCSEVR